MKTLLAVPLLSLALGVQASCPVKKPGPIPQFPDGALASSLEMHHALLTLGKYLAQGDAYIDCAVMNKRQYNQLLAKLEMAAEDYQESFVSHLSQMEMVAEN